MWKWSRQGNENGNVGVQKKMTRRGAGPKTSVCGWAKISKSYARSRFWGAGVGGRTQSESCQGLLDWVTSKPRENRQKQGRGSGVVKTKATKGHRVGGPRGDRQTE